MTVESDFYALISGAGSVTALVAARIYPDVLPEECVYPAIVFARGSTDLVYSISGQCFGGDVSLNVGCWAKTRGAADGVAAAVIAALTPGVWTTPGQDAAYDPETGLYATTLVVTKFSTSG